MNPTLTASFSNRVARLQSLTRLVPAAVRTGGAGTLALLTLAGCESTSTPDLELSLTDGPQVVVGAMTTEHGTHHAGLAVDGLEGDVVIWTDGDTLSLSQYAGGYDLLLTVDELGMTLELSDGVDLQKIMARRVTEQEDSALLDVLPAAALADRPLSGPFGDDQMHRVALNVLAHASTLDPSIAPFLDDALALTAKLEQASLHTVQETLGSQRSRDNSPSIATAPEDPVLIECDEYSVVKTWKEEAAAGTLDAGPVTASVGGPKVEGTSLCAPRGTISLSSSNTFSPSYVLSGAGGFACPTDPGSSQDYEASYTVSGTMQANASHAHCCVADGQADHAEAGSLTLSVYRSTFELSGKLASSNTDMGSAAEGKISGSAVVCLDTDWLNEALLMSNTITVGSWIN